MTSSDPTSWQLPPGVPRGVWNYAQSDEIARDYDEDLRQHSLAELDRQIVQRHRPASGVVIDLGSGTGRALLPLVRQGLFGLAVDLSPKMLDRLRQKAAEQATPLPLACVRANLVELDCLADDAAEMILCLFSTLGMIEGHANRQRVLQHAGRILKPGGKLVLHVHNRWHRLFDPQGRRWLLRQLLPAVLRREPRGDNRFSFRHIRDFYLHLFTWGELRTMLRVARFDLLECTPVGTAAQGRLPRPWLLGGCRASGWIVVCQKPA